jgi:hypothetical protein
MGLGQCHDCGAPVRYVTPRPYRDQIALDAREQMRPPGRPDLTLYRLVGEDQESAEKMPGKRADLMGYIPHAEICPAKDRQRI